MPGSSTQRQPPPYFIDDPDPNLDFGGGSFNGVDDMHDPQRQPVNLPHYQWSDQDRSWMPPGPAPDFPNPGLPGAGFHGQQIDWPNPGLPGAGFHDQLPSPDFPNPGLPGAGFHDQGPIDFPTSSPVSASMLEGQAYDPHQFVRRAMRRRVNKGY